MRAKRTIITLVPMLLLSAASIYAQRVDVELHVKGIEEAKGKVMIALGDLNEPQKVFAGIKEVTETGELVFVIQGVPDEWKTDLNVFQDLDGDGKLFINPNGMPTEPCAAKKVTITADNPTVEITLMDIQKMFGGL